MGTVYPTQILSGASDGRAISPVPSALCATPFALRLEYS